MTNSEFKALVEAVATAMLAQSKPRSVRRSKPKATFTRKALTTPSWNVDTAAKEAAAKAGFDATPRVDLLTAKAWAEKGMFPKAGTKAVRVKKPGSKGLGMPLFHASQMESRVAA